MPATARRPARKQHPAHAWRAPVGRLRRRRPGRCRWAGRPRKGATRPQPDGRAGAPTATAPVSPVCTLKWSWVVPCGSCAQTWCRPPHGSRIRQRAVRGLAAAACLHGRGAPQGAPSRMSAPPRLRDRRPRQPLRMTDTFFPLPPMTSPTPSPPPPPDPPVAPAAPPCPHPHAAPPLPPPLLPPTPLPPHLRSPGPPFPRPDLVGVAHTRPIQGVARSPASASSLE